MFADNFLSELDRYIEQARMYRFLGPGQIDGLLASLAARKAEAGRTKAELVEYAKRREALNELRRGKPQPLGFRSV